MSRQRTIEKPVEVSGRGLFSGRPCRLRFVPAPADAGVTFVRTDLAEPARLHADVEHLGKRARRTSLKNGSVSVETIEHVMSAVNGLGIDNVEVELTAEETPSFDGSARPFADALVEAGSAELEADRRAFVIDRAVTVSDDDAMLAALPGPTDHLDIVYDLDYSQTAPEIGRQVATFKLGADDFAERIAPARTFSLKAEAEEMQARGLGAHLTARDVLVVGPEGPIDNAWRFPDEAARHKICDMVGDLALFGRPIYGRIVAHRSGHEHNHALVRKLLRALEERARSTEAGEPAMDIRKIMRLLPHRYPFLMVDRILEIDGDRKATAVKNVSINEPYFQGHYPGQPIMPGVMILESLAQLSGILLSRRLEHTGKVAVLLSMDRVKMRRPVRPGDQLIIEAERVHVRSRTGHCKCRARVAGELAAEAEIKFMLVDAEPI